MAEAGKKKGAPPPRSKRGRTVNRRRARFLAKAAKRVDRLVREAGSPLTIERLREEIERSKAAQAARIAIIKK